MRFDFEHPEYATIQRILFHPKTELHFDIHPEVFIVTITYFSFIINYHYYYYYIAIIFTPLVGIQYNIIIYMIIDLPGTHEQYLIPT